jgi:hypothetical protein
MSEHLAMDSTTTVDGTIAILFDLNGEVAFIARTEASFVGYINAEVRIPFPTLDGEMKVKH